MSFGGGPPTPSLPEKPVTPPPPPPKNDPKILSSRSRASQKNKAQRGRAATIATSGRGVLSEPANTARKDLLGK